MVKITVLALALAFPLAAGLVGPEIPLSTPLLEPAPGLRHLPRVASNGSEFLVVWRENHGALRAMRLDANGLFLHREPLELDHGGYGGGLDVASDGRDFVVVSHCGDLWTLSCITRVDAGTGSVTRAGTIGSAIFPVIASNGNGYLVAYRTRSGAVEAVPLRADGSVAGAAYAVARSSFPPALASNGDRYFVVAGTDDQLDGFLLTEHGVGGPRQRLSDGAPTGAYRVASDGDGFLVTWGERLTRTATELRAARVSPGGLASPSHSILPVAASHALAWHATRYIVTYTTPAFDVASFELSATGEPASAPVPVAAHPHPEEAPALASNGRTALAVWSRQWSLGAEIEARLLGSDSPSSSFVVSRAVPAQQSIAATRRGAGSVVAWDENGGPDQVRKVYVQRLDANGLPLDGRGIPLGDSPRHQVRPALAGSVIAWIETETLTELTGVAQVWASTLDFSGRPAGTPFLVGEAAQGTRVAVADPGGPLQFILWSSPDGRIMAARFDPFSRVGYDPAPFAVSSGGIDREVVVVSNGAGFLVAWKRVTVYTCPAFCQSAALHAAAFTQWGDPLGPSFELTPANARLPALVWNGAEYVVFWSPWSGGQSYAQRVSATGTPIGAPHPVGRRRIEAAAWTGTEYRLALLDQHVLKVARLGRDLLSLVVVAPIGRPAGEGAVLFPDLLLYLAPYRGSGDVSPRVVARRLGDDAALPRRRTTAPR